MPRPKKVQDEIEHTDEAKLEETKRNLLPTGIDVQALVDEVKGRYGKNEKALADDLTTGDNIQLPDEDSDYVLSNTLRSWWSDLVGVRGIPFGRIVQIAGKSDSGKSTTAMAFMRAAQEAGVLVILWDAEKKFGIKRYKNYMGGDPNTLLVTRNKSILNGAKQVIQYIKVAKEQNPDVKILIVWDSVGATLNEQEDDEGDDYSKQPGVTAKQVGWAMKKFNSVIERYRNLKTGKETIACLCINQVYQLIGSVGSKEKGGEQLYYLSSVILQLSRKKDLNRVTKGNKVKFGIVTRAKVRKNHLFDGEECIAELDLVVSAGGIQLASDVKGKSDIVGWDDEED